MSEPTLLRALCIAEESDSIEIRGRTADGIRVYGTDDHYYAEGAEYVITAADLRSSAKYLRRAAAVLAAEAKALDALGAAGG